MKDSANCFDSNRKREEENSSLFLPRPVDTAEGAACFYKGIYLYSKYHPVTLAVKTASGWNLREETLYLVPSPLYGYGIAELKKRLPENSHLLCVEADQTLMAHSVQRLGKDILDDPAVTVVRTENGEALYSQCEKLGPERFRRCEMIILNQGYKINKDIYDTLYNHLSNRILNYWENRITLIHLGRLYIKNLLKNLEYLPKAKRLSSLKTDRPVLITGAGPSLESALPLIRKTRERIFLLSVDTALPFLLKSGLKPDAVVVLESQFYNIYDFYDAGKTGIPCIADITAYHPSLLITGGPLYIYSSDFASVSLLSRMEKYGIRPETLPPLGSVGVTALRLAERLGSGPVITAGLDFAYFRGMSHVRGTLSHTLGLIRHDRKSVDYLYPYTQARTPERLPGENGKAGWVTDRALKLYGRQFAENAASKDIRTITPQRLDLGLRYLGEKEYLEFLDDYNPEPPVERYGTQDTSRPIKNDQEGFIRNESALLDRVIESWEKYASAGSGKEALLNNLAEVDYTTLHIPDRLSRLKDEPNYLTRAVTAAREYRSILDRYL